MLRELSATLLDLHAGFAALAAHAPTPNGTIRLTGLEIALPVDIVTIFADGGCRLLADAPRTRTEGSLAGPPSQLRVRFEQCPLEDAAGTRP